MLVGTKPAMFRDGVGTGQLIATGHVEVMHIQEA
jgi:hypothetical protein